MENTNREIIVYKLNPQNNSDRGYLRAIAEHGDDGYKPLNQLNFCMTEKVFVTTDYNEIDAKYQSYEIFKITISESHFHNTEIPNEKNCRYVTQGFKSTSLKPRELVEIINGVLPDPNNPILAFEKLPSTAYIYIVDKRKDCFGPFKWEFQEEYGHLLLKKIDTPLPGRTLYTGSIFKGNLRDLPEHILTCELPEGLKYFFKDLTALHNNPALNSIDFSSDMDIIGLFSKIAKELHYNNANKKIDFHFLENQIKKFPKFNQKSIIEKLPKFKDIANENYGFKDEIIEGLEKFLKSPIGEKIIENHILDHKDEYLTEIKDNYYREIEIEVRDKRNELSDLQNKIEINKKELVDLGKEIEDRNKLKFDVAILDNAKKHSDLEQKIEIDKKRLEDLNKEYDLLNSKYLNLKTYDQILKELEEAKHKYKYEMKKQIEIEKETTKLSNLYRESEDNLRQRIFDLKPFVEAINGNIISDKKNHIMSVDLKPSSQAIHAVDLIINDLEQLFKKDGRMLSAIEIINLLISTQQSFLCLFAGLPGGGKTTLVRLLAQVLGVKNKRFLEIPVARGWTGQKDLIGYHNPISNKFQPSSTGMYQFLTALHQDYYNEGEKSSSYILLDEANLSPIEHYWSSFMGISDIIDSKQIRLGENEVTIPDNLRFIATINYDNTTELLSHRVLDRASVILIENNEINTQINNIYNNNEITLEMPLSYKTMNSYFGASSEIPDFTPKEQRIIDQIKALLGDKNIELGKSIKISNRKEIAVRHYCSKARPLMRAYSDDDDLLALDYAILQLLLPQIRGNGRNFGQRLNKLLDVLNSNDLQKSSECLINVIRNGAIDLHTFDFFCW